MKKSKTPVSKHKIVATLTILGLPTMTVKDKSMLSAWLLAKSREVYKSTEKYDKRFTARLHLVK